MEISELEQLFADQWKVSVASCYDSLERDDLRQVTFFNTWNDVQKQILRAQEDHLPQATRQEFAMLTPGLIQFKVFIDFFSRRLVPKLDVSVFGGLFSLITKLVQDEDGAIPRIPRMLRELFHKVDILNSYCSDIPTLIPQIREAGFEAGLAILSFFLNVVKFLRSDVEYSYLGTGVDEWQPLVQQFNTTTREIDKSLSRVEKLSKLTRRSDEMDDNIRMQSILSLSRPSSHPEEVAKLPCVVLPPIRTSRFFDRTDVIEKIEAHFSKVDPDRSFRSLALYGLGGVGKSSVALRYAETKLRRGELDAIFWVHSEKLVTIRQSFTDIALRLKLPDARPKDHDENHATVLDWFRDTQCRWLIVYDNAENMDILCTHWPAASRGQAIITTRNHSFAFEPADGGLEIGTWDAETGSRFLLHLLSTDISEELTVNEAKSAQELSQKLSGHALAISHMAGLIHRRAWSIAEFIEIYNQHPSEMHGVSGNTSINALWDFAFKSLDSQSRAILGVLCFVAPDSIPQALFEVEFTTDLPESLQFCSDQLRFSEVTENLLTLALIKRDKGSRTFSLHRLVQTSFKYFMTSEGRQKSFNDAAILVSHAFPRRDSTVAQLYLMWDRCALYLQHVLMLKDCFREEKKSNSRFTPLKTYCDLNNACQRYLLETNVYAELEDLIQVNTMALSTLPQEDQTIGLQGSLTSHTGQLLSRLGKPSDGVTWLKKSYEVRSHDEPFNPQESAWAAVNAANGIATLNDFVEADRWYKLARDHWQEWSNTQILDKGAWPADIKKSWAMALIWAGQLERARDLLAQSIQQIESKKPYNWAMAAYTHFALGNLDRREHNLESAEAHFIEAQNLWLKGDQLRTDPFNAACMYKMGCTVLDQGKVEAAIKHLRDAMVVTEMRKVNMVAEHARCVFKMSEALEQEPREGIEAGRLREEAEHLLRRRNPDANEPGRESTYDNLVNIRWR